MTTIFKKPVTTALSLLILASAGLTSVNATASACVTGGSSEATLQEVFNDNTVGGASSVNANSGCLSHSDATTWGVNSGGDAVITMVREIAGHAGSNTLGIYDATDSGTTVELFSGSDSANAQTTLSIDATGSVFINGTDSGVSFAGNAFGFYLGTDMFGNFFSDSALNGGMADHMLAYQGEGDEILLPAGTWGADQYALAWEDLPYTNTDNDFNDMVVMLSGVSPVSQVPLPAAVWLFGSGLLGLVGMARRRTH